jgi:squalene synthase HpnC
VNNDTINRSFKYCEEIARNHYENFPVASRLIPEDKRKYIYSIYAFARTADDFADEPGIGGQDERLRLINGWKIKLDSCYSNDEFDESQPVFIALKQTIKDRSLPVEPMANLLKAFSQDVVKNRYKTFSELLSYCENSANPIGRLMLMILGNEKLDEAFEYSDNICTALQLTNFWQDVKIDLLKNRVYIPLEDMERFGYNEEMLFGRIFNQPFRNLMEFEIQRTEKLFDKGERLVGMVKFKRELKLILLGGREILNKIRRNNYDVFNKRPAIGKLDALKLFAKANIF